METQKRPGQPTKMSQQILQKRNGKSLRRNKKANIAARAIQQA